MENSTWGKITGIRPIKLVKNMILEGMTPSEAKNNFMLTYGVSDRKANLSVDIALREIDLLKDIKKDDICLYIGIPFCRTRCLYCSFITAESGTCEHLIKPFIAALLKEIEFTGELVKKHKMNIVSMYIGGGTPTILSAENLSTVINYCKDSFDLSNLKEFTVEAGRPDTIDDNKLKAMKNSGVTRISINPQSMNDTTLNTIGRKHTANDIRDTFHLARSFGFNNINMDVIAGLPFESTEDFKYTLHEVDKLNPESVTVHTMSIKRGSGLCDALGDYDVSNHEDVAEMVDYALEFMKNSRRFPYYLYRQKNMLGNFENVGYSKAYYECLYNIIIMEEISTIISLGGGGVTKIVNKNTGKIDRVFNVKEPKDYIERIDEMIERKKLISIYL